MPMVSVNFQLCGDINSESDWEELILVAGSESPYKPAGTLCTRKVPLEGTLFRCEFYTQKTDSGLCDQLVDLMIYFDLLWDEGKKVILSVDDFPGVLDMACHFTSFHSYCGARCRGAQHGRVLHRTMWTTLGRNIRCSTLLRWLTWHAGFRHGQSPEQYGARP